MASTTTNNPALDPDSDTPDNPGHEFAQFGSGCFWGAELRFQRVVGVVKTEVGYSQGHVHDPNYKLVCSGTTNHSEVVRVQFDPQVCPYSDLLSVFWSRHDPTTLNRQVWGFLFRPYHFHLNFDAKKFLAFSHYTVHTKSCVFFFSFFLNSSWKKVLFWS